MLVAHERRASRAGNPLPGRDAAQCGDHLPGRPAALGAKSGQADRVRMLLSKLAAKGVKRSICGRQSKRRGPKGRPIYMHDTHWTFRGALAAYNAIVEADAHPDWRIEPASALGPMTLRKGGDIAREDAAGSATPVSEYAEALTLPLSQEEGRYQSSDQVGGLHVKRRTRPARRFSSSANSFTVAYFPPMVLQHAGRVVWMSHHGLRFRLGRDGQDTAPTRSGGCPAERFLVCLPGAEAEGLARERDVDSAHEKRRCTEQGLQRRWAGGPEVE